MSAPPAAAKRSRNYLGDISLALAIAGTVGALVFRTPAWSLYVLIGAVILSIIALTRARAIRSRTTATVALVVSGLLVGFALILYAVSTR
ncbi:MAG: hypothetical protein ABIQ01_11235 [Pseudolysinimonas sp.]